MTRKEYEEERYELLNTIADRIKTVEVASRKMNDFENIIESRLLIKKMSEELKYADRCYQSMMSLENEAIDD